MATTTLSTPIDTSRVPTYFSYLPVRIHKEVAAIDSATHDAIETCAPKDSKERKQALYRHTNPYGSPYALCHAEYITEELPYALAQHEHEILRQGLDPLQDHNSDVGKTVGVKKEYLRNARDGMLALDPIGTPGVLQTLDHYLIEFPMQGIESASVREFEWTLGGVLALTNDYFSWRKEKLQSTDRIRNAVPVLMHQHGLSQDVARVLLKGFIIEEEEKAKNLRKALEEGDMSPDMKRYVEALELYAGGNCYWSATCPRYNKPQEEE